MQGLCTVASGAYLCIRAHLRGWCVIRPLCPIESCPVSLLFGRGQAMNGTNVTAPPTLDPSRNLLWMGTANGTVLAFNTRALERVLCVHTRVYSRVCAGV